MAKDDNKKFYFTPIKAEDRAHALKDLAERKISITIWKKGDEKKSKQFEIMALDESTGTLTLKMKELGFLERLSKSEETFASHSELVLFKTPLHSYQYFSSGHINYNQEKDLYTLAVHHDMYRAEQRQDYRLESNEHNTLQFAFQDKIYRAIDASAGGVCIGISSPEKVLFPKGTIFANCFISINGKRFKVSEAKVVKVSEAEILTPEKRSVRGYKIGIQFLSVSEKEREELCKHVINEARKEDEARREK